MRAGPLPDLVLGKADAPVTIVEYASMTCPHCANFHKTTYPELKTKYIDTGKVRFIFREFPLDELAAAASMLARCTERRTAKRRWPLIEVLFASQDKWAVRQPLPAAPADRQAGGPHPAGLRQRAWRTKSSTTTCSRCGNGEPRNTRWSRRPTLFVNGKLQKGGATIEELEKLIAPYLKS